MGHQARARAAVLIAQRLPDRRSAALFALSPAAGQSGATNAFFSAPSEGITCWAAFYMQMEERAEGDTRRMDRRGVACLQWFELTE